MELLKCKFHGGNVEYKEEEYEFSWSDRRGTFDSWCWFALVVGCKRTLFILRF